MYKSTIKQQIRDWLSVISRKKNQEWLIILLNNSSNSNVNSNKANNLFKIKSSIIDKIKLDFNVDKRDRCIQVSRIGVNGIEDKDCWSPLINKLKLSIINGFDNNLKSRLNDVEKSENQINLPGWNFYTYFILKESIALSYLGLKLYEKSYSIYRDLETFYQFSLNHHHSIISQFSTFGADQNNDDSLNLFKFDVKPYRQMILSNSISVFDFKLYLFKSISNILGNHLHNLNQILKFSLNFIKKFSIEISNSITSSSNVKNKFVTYWRFSNFLDVIEQCDHWSKVYNIRMDEDQLIEYKALKSELIELTLSEVGVIFM